MIRFAAEGSKRKDASVRSGASGATGAQGAGASPPSDLLAEVQGFKVRPVALASMIVPTSNFGFHVFFPDSGISTVLPAPADARGADASSPRSGPENASGREPRPDRHEAQAAKYALHC